MSSRAGASVDYQEQAMKRIPEIVSEAFIWGVGITRPKPGKERTAALFITLILFGTLVALVLVFLLLLRVM
jgi:hypothetical protein